MILTPRRRAILAAMRKNGRLLTWRDMRDALGLASTDTVHYHLSALRRHGYVDWEPYTKRTLRLTGKGLLASQGYEEIYRVSKDGTLLKEGK